MKRITILSLIIILFITGCATSEKFNPVTESEQQKIITFTQQALEVEDKRNELMRYFGNSLYQTKILIDSYFLEGVPTTAVNAPASELEGMVTLRKQLLFLECPQSLQAIKQSLLEIYQVEIGLAEIQLDQENLPWLPTFGDRLVLCELTIDNLSYWMQLAEQTPSWTALGMQYAKVVQSDWFKAQEFRLEVYTRWAEILKEHGVDPLEEGLTSLIK